jgi:glycosyltransferase involved in cell wall biosynthesis
MPVITTDIHGLERVASPGTIVQVYPASQYADVWQRRWCLFRAALGSEHLVVHFSLTDVMFFTFLLALFPFHRCRLTTLDFFIGDPDRGGLKQMLVCWSLNRVDRFLVYFKDSSVFERSLNLPRSRFFYIPFKINALELILSTPATDEGYIFCGGRSRRDFATLFAAVEPLGFPVKIVTSSHAVMSPHGSSLEGLRVPANVEISTKDQSAEFFVRTMAAARLVVLPIVRDSTTQAGIGVYLQGMALGKCVIVSSGLGVSDVLTPELAIIVEAGKPEDLRHAIEQTWNNQDLRQRYAEAGLQYARALGGEDDLRRSVLRSLPPV